MCSSEILQLLQVKDKITIQRYSRVIVSVVHTLFTCYPCPSRLTASLARSGESVTASDHVTVLTAVVYAVFSIKPWIAF